MKFSFLLLITLVLSLNVSCGKNDSDLAAAGKTNPGTGGGSSSGGGNNSNDNAWLAASDEMNNSAVNSKTLFKDFPLFHINFILQTLEITLPMLNGTTPAATPIIPGNIPGLAGVSITPILTPDGNSAWLISVPLKNILKHTNIGPFLATLPSGMPLPNFPSGEVHGITFSINQFKNYKLTLYVALKATAVFIEIPELKIPLGAGFTIKNKAKTRQLGYIAVIPNQGSFSGGVYVAAQFPDDIANALNSLVSF